MNQKEERDSGMHDKHSNIIKHMSVDTLSDSRTPVRILNGAMFCSCGRATATAEGLPIFTLIGHWIGRPGNKSQIPTARY